MAKLGLKLYSVTPTDSSTKLDDDGREIRLPTQLGMLQEYDRIAVDSKRSNMLRLLTSLVRNFNVPTHENLFHAKVIDRGGVLSYGDNEIADIRNTEGLNLSDTIVLLAPTTDISFKRVTIVEEAENRFRLDLPATECSPAFSIAIQISGELHKTIDVAPTGGMKDNISPTFASDYISVPENLTYLVSLFLAARASVDGIGGASIFNLADKYTAFVVRPEYLQNVYTIQTLVYLN